jgi:hypothetical protein
MWCNSPAITDTFPLRRGSLSHSTLLKFCRALVAQSRVQPPPIIKTLQVLENRHPRRLTGKPAVTVQGSVFSVESQREEHTR